MRSRISMECIVQDYHCAMVSTLNCLSCRRSCHDGGRIHVGLFFSFLLTILGAVVCGGAEFPSSHAGQRGHAIDNLRRDDSVARIASAISAPVLGFGPGGLPALRAGIRLRGGASVTVRLEVRTIMPEGMQCGCARALSHQNATISAEIFKSCCSWCHLRTRSYTRPPCQKHATHTFAHSLITQDVRI